MSDALQIPDGMRLPTYDELAEKLIELSQERSEWAGFPIPIAEMPLRLEPRFPYQLNLCSIKEEDQGKLEYDLVNEWWSERLRCYVQLARRLCDGKILSCFRPVGGGATMILNTLGAVHVWRWEAETKAVSKLAALIGDWRIKCYMLTGSFLESSKRSGVVYIFRRLRPTIAFRNDKILCGLCLHPIGYYSQSWAGAMTPTDDVLAHLCMMRGSEEKFWAHAGQHHPRHPECGLL